MRPISIGGDGQVWLLGWLLHGASQPLQAAAQELKPLLDQATANDVVVIMGTGLGWHIKAALGFLKPEQIIIYQTHPDEAALATCLGPELPEGLVWVDNSADLAAALGQRLVYAAQQLGRVAVFAAPAYRQAYPELYQEIKLGLQRAASRSASDHHTRAKLRSIWNKDLAQNAAVLFSQPDIWNSAGSFSGVPALVVGAGPSLDDSLSLLKNVRHKALVLGAASVLGPMAAHKLKPHVVVALEAKDESRQFIDPQGINLLAALHGHPAHFSAWPGAQTFFHASGWLPHLLGVGGMLPTGGHATSAAFSLACLWGCNPIILVGQDLAYTGGKVHASARPGGEEERQSQRVAVPALGGGQVFTSPVMQSYLEWYREAAAHLSRQHPHIKVINASAAGAAISGFTPGALDEVLAELPTLPEDLGSKVTALFTGLPLLNPRQAHAAISNARRLIAKRFTSYEELNLNLQGSALQVWLDEECAPGDWQLALDDLHLVLDALAKELSSC